MTRRSRAERRKLEESDSDSKSVFDTPPAVEFFRSLERVTLDPETYRTEILRLHENRRIRKLSLDRTVNAQRLQRANSEEQAIRSRLVEIMLECKRIERNIERLLDAITLQLLTAYASKIPTSTKGEKRQYLVQGFNRRLPLLAALKDTIEHAEYVIEDIDQGAYSLQRMGALYEISTRPEVH